MILSFLLIARSNSAEIEVCLYGDASSSSLCPEGVSESKKFSDVSDSILLQNPNFVIVGESDNTHQDLDPSSQLTPIFKIISRADELLVEKLTFKSLNQRQKILVPSNVKTVNVKVSFTDIDFITVTESTSLVYKSIVMIGCTIYGQSGNPYAALSVTDLLEADVYSLINYQNIVTSTASLSKIRIIDGVASNVNKIYAYPDIKVFLKASVFIENANSFSEVKLVDTSSTISIEITTIDDFYLSISSISKINDNSITISYGNSSASGVNCVTEFAESKPLSSNSFPTINFITSASCQITFSGKWKSWDNAELYAIQKETISLTISHDVLLSFKDNRFPYVIHHKDGKLDITTDKETTLDGEIHEYTEDGFSLSTQSSASTAYIKGGIKFYANPPKIVFNNPEITSLEVGTLDFTELGSFDVLPLKFELMRKSSGGVFFPSIKMTGVEKPLLNGVTVIVDPKVPMLPTLTNDEVQALSSQDRLTFFTAPSGSGFATAKISFPLEQGQHGFWAGASILDPMVDTTSGVVLKARVNAEKRSQIPLKIAYSLSPVSGYYTFNESNPQSFYDIIPEAVPNVQVKIASEMKVNFDFSLFASGQKTSSISISGDGPSQSVTFTGTSNMKEINFENLMIDTELTSFEFAAANAVIENCYFSQQAAESVKFKEGCNISLSFTWDLFKDFCEKRKNAGLACEFLNAKLSVAGTTDITEISFKGSDVLFHFETVEYQVVFNDKVNQAVFKQLGTTALKMTSVISDTSDMLQPFTFMTNGEVSISGQWNRNAFADQISLGSVSSTLKLTITNTSIPYFKVLNEAKTEFILDSELVKGFNNGTGLEFPSWFTSHSLKASTEKFIDGANISVFPNTNTIVFEKINVPFNTTLTFRNVDIQTSLTLETASRVTITKALKYPSLINMYWSSLEGFPYIEFPDEITSSQSKSPVINIRYNTTSRPTTDSFNELFSTPIPGTSNTGVHIINNPSSIETTLITFSALPEPISNTKLYGMSLDSGLYVMADTFDNNHQDQSTPKPNQNYPFPLWLLIICIIAGVILVATITACIVRRIDRHNIGNVSNVNGPSDQVELFAEYSSSYYSYSDPEIPQSDDEHSQESKEESQQSSETTETQSTLHDEEKNQNSIQKNTSDSDPSSDSESTVEPDEKVRMPVMPSPNIPKSPRARIHRPNLV